MDDDDSNDGLFFHRDDSGFFHSADLVDGNGNILYDGATCLKIVKIAHDRGYLAFSFDGDEWNTVHGWTKLSASRANGRDSQ